MVENVPPYPADSGSDLTQVAGDESPVVEAIEPGAVGLPLEVITATARLNPKEFGRGTFPGSILASMFFEKNEALQNALDKIERLEEKIEKKTDELSSLKEILARYSERLGTSKRSEAKTQILNVVAAALIGIAVDLYKSGITPLAYILGVGSLLVLLNPFIDIIWRSKDENERS